MRLSEKTLELNICAQASGLLAPRQQLFWFGLTQRQEARAGFDACTKLGGRLLIFQFKASNRVLRSGERVFLAPHDQMSALRARVRSSVRSVFYGFPLIGTTRELSLKPNLLAQTWLLDVAGLPPTIPEPTVIGGSALRRNRCHNIYVTPGNAKICSDPINTDVLSMAEVVQSQFPGADGIGWHFEDNFERFWEFTRPLSRGARGLVVW